MKISINGIEIIKNKDYSGASIRGSQDHEFGVTYVDLTIHDLTIDHKAFQILDASFRNCETVNVKILSEGAYEFDRDLNMAVRSEDVAINSFSDIPTSSFNLECHR